MTPVDVSTQIVIDRPAAEVAAYAMDPEHAPRWYGGIRAVEWKGEPGVRPGARVVFIAQFLGRRLAYEFEIGEAVPGERLVLRSVDGPFPLETRYTFESLDGGRTRVTQRHSARPAGFAQLASRVLMYAMHRPNAKDLELLKALLEGGNASRPAAPARVRA